MQGCDALLACSCCTDFSSIEACYVWHHETGISREAFGSVSACRADDLCMSMSVLFASAMAAVVAAFKMEPMSWKQFPEL